MEKTLKKGRGGVVLFVGAILTVIAGVAERIMDCIKLNTFGDVDNVDELISSDLQGFLIFSVVGVVGAVVVWVFLRKAKLKAIRYSIALLYVVISVSLVLFAVFAPPHYSTGMEYVHISSVAISTPAIITFLLMSVICIVDEKMDDSAAYPVLLVIFTGVIPFLANMITHRIAAFVLYPATAFLLISRLAADKKMKKKHFVYFCILCAIIGILALMVLLKNVYIKGRLYDVFTRGVRDPYGTGFYLVQFDNAIDKIKLFGAVDFNIGKVPADCFFTGFSYTGLESIMFNYGWVAFGGTVIAAALMCGGLYRRAAAAENAYGRYYCYTVASFFMFRTISSVLITYIMPMNGIAFPFMVSRHIFVADLILLASAIAVSGRPAETEEDNDKLREKIKGLIKKIIALWSAKADESYSFSDELPVGSDTELAYDLEYLFYGYKLYYAANRFTRNITEHTGKIGGYSETDNATYKNLVCARLKYEITENERLEYLFNMNIGGMSLEEIKNAEYVPDENSILEEYKKVTDKANEKENDDLFSIQELVKELRILVETNGKLAEMLGLEKRPPENDVLSIAELYNLVENKLIAVMYENHDLVTLWAAERSYNNDTAPDSIGDSQKTAAAADSGKTVSE